jgi:hypothetical protein
MKIRSYKREFLDKVKEKFNDLQSISKNNKNPFGIASANKERKKCDTKRVAIR